MSDAPRSPLLRYGSTALVTGASSGIGQSFARRLAAEGFLKIVLVARREERLLQLQAELEAKEGCTCVVVALDLAATGAAQSLVQSLEALGVSEVDVVINNAGFGLLGPLESLPIDKASSMVDLNCRAVVEIAHAFLPGMKKRGRGAMIITSSVVGAVPTPWFSVYAATKAFDLYLGEALHAECQGSGVDVLTVLPGLTRTEFHAGLGAREYHAPYRTAEQVVQSSLSALGKKSIVVDGIPNKIMVHGLRFLPRGISLWLSRRVMKFELGL
jgi:short-subunit dehydrogenase